MILHLSDWNNYPNAIVHYNTRNKSFLHIAMVYRDMKVDNHLFMLTLHNRDLEYIDPFDQNLTDVQKMMVLEEVTINPWYYLREIVRVPAKGGIDYTMFQANKIAITLFWTFFNNIPLMLIAIRQTGKTFSVACLFRGLLNFWLVNTDVNLITKDTKLRTATVESLKDIEGEFPSYLKMTTKKDTDNKEGITVNVINNKYLTQIAQSSLAAALNAARGLTSSTFHIDEFGYIYNIKDMLAPALSAGTKARANAKRDNVPYGTIFTTTSARRDLPSGEFAYKVYSSGAEFVESLFDIGSKEALAKYVRRHTLKGEPPLLVAEFNHRQLGYTDEWLAITLEESRATGLDAEADFFNKWPDGSSASPLSEAHVSMIDKSEEEVQFLSLTGEGYAIRWYVSEHEYNTSLRNEELVAGLDTSDAVGQDDIAIVIRRVKTGEVVGAGQYNNLNTAHYAEWLFEVLVMFPKLLLIAERRSTAITILDILLLRLLEAKIDPFTRLFNWVVNDYDMNTKQYAQIKNGMTQRDNIVYDNYRKDIGFATSGSGRTSRSRLYGETFLDSVKFTGAVTRDKRLIKQILGLREKNNRIDHSNGGHDDLVIGWLLTYWFLSKAKNVGFYNINPHTLLSNVVSNSANVKDDIKIKEHKTQQLQLKTEIERLISAMSTTTNPVLINRLTVKLTFLDKQVDKSISANTNIEVAIAEVLNKNVKSSAKRVKRRLSIPKRY